MLGRSQAARRAVEAAYAFDDMRLRTTVAGFPVTPQYSLVWAALGRPRTPIQTIRLGPSLVQVLTALVDAGSGLVKEIKLGLLKLLERDGFRNVTECVGPDAR